MASAMASFMRLPWRRKRRLVEAIFAVSGTTALLRVTSYRRTRSILCALSPQPGQSNDSSLSNMQVTNDLVWAASAAAYKLPVDSTCLNRSLALWWMLRWRRLDSQLRIGTAGSHDDFHAHAWLEMNGVVINDHADIRDRFTAFDDIK